MDIETYARQSVLSLKILRWMVVNEMIGNPLSGNDFCGLQLLEKTWCKREILRSQLRQFSKKRRQQLINSADFETKWERYAYSRMSNLGKGERLPLKKLIDEGVRIHAGRRCGQIFLPRKPDDQRGQDRFGHYR